MVLNMVLRGKDLYGGGPNMLFGIVEVQSVLSSACSIVQSCVGMTKGILGLECHIQTFYMYCVHSFHTSVCILCIYLVFLVCLFTIYECISLC